MIHERKKRSPLIKTIDQAKRLIKIVIGFTVLLVGCIMLVTPGPGIAAIVGGLAILGTEFVWAKRLMNRFKDGANHLKNSVMNNSKNKSK
ncbi:MAG: PGPGW domain-containing protein [Nitrospirae bacterium]|nr:PGPGW domain-containing protein [Nitrospirota bacterium]